MEALVIELLKAWGPPALLCIFMWFSLQDGKKREKLKDDRIQLLENKITESYDERIAAADSITSALNSNARALETLTNELRQKRGR